MEEEALVPPPLQKSILIPQKSGFEAKKPEFPTLAGYPRVITKEDMENEELVPKNKNILPQQPLNEHLNIDDLEYEEEEEEDDDLDLLLDQYYQDIFTEW